MGSLAEFFVPEIVLCIAFPTKNPWRISLVETAAAISFDEFCDAYTVL